LDISLFFIRITTAMAIISELIITELTEIVEREHLSIVVGDLRHSIRAIDDLQQGIADVIAADAL
jgi:hypothetical protein